MSALLSTTHQALRTMGTTRQLQRDLSDRSEITAIYDERKEAAGNQTFGMAMQAAAQNARVLHSMIALSHSHAVDAGTLLGVNVRDAEHVLSILESATRDLSGLLRDHAPRSAPVLMAAE